VIPKTKYYDEFESATTVSVEIYDLRNCNTRMGGEFLKTEKPVYTVPEERKEEFLTDLAQIQFTDFIIITIAAIDPSFDYGDWVIRVNHMDGSFVLISDAGYGESYDANGQFVSSNHYSCEDEDWNQFIGAYVPPEILLKLPGQHITPVAQK
jgi:hypothetical protein